MSQTVALVQDPILRFTLNDGTPAVGGSLLTQVGGVNYPTYSESTGTVELKNPIPLNARGEISTATGISSPLFVVPNVAYTFSLFDANDNLIWSAPNITSPSTLNAVLSGLTQSLLGATLYGAQTPAEITAQIVPTNTGYEEGDIRRYGALTSASDNGLAITAALLVSASGGAAAYIPGGIWPVTTAPVATLSSCMHGEGAASILVPTGCDGLQFTAQPSYEGTRFFSDFVISGTDPVVLQTVSQNNGITITIAGGRLTGIVFQNLTIQNMACAVYLATSVNGQGGLWNSEFRNCFFYNNYQGYYFNGQVIQLQIEGGMVQTGPMLQPTSGPLAGVTTRYGLYCGLGAGIQPQSLHCHGMGIYAYDINVCLGYAYYAVLADCDLSQYMKYGVQITTVQGNIVLEGTWIQAAAVAGPVVGVQIDDLGSPAPQKILINGCNLQGNGVAKSIGIYCGSDQTAITLTNNTIGTASASFDYGIAGIGSTPGASSPNLIAKFNTIYALTADVSVNTSALNCEIGPNVNQNSGTSTPFLCATSPTGMRYRANGAMSGTATFASATTVAVTLPVAMPNATYRVTNGGNSAGDVWESAKSTTGFTLNCRNSSATATEWAIGYG